jgi:uncharacterized protein YkwD
VTRLVPGSSVDRVRRALLAGLAATIALGAPPAHAAGDRSIVWAADTRSPLLADDPPVDALERSALARCGTEEARLRDVARVLVTGKVEGLPIPEMDDVELLRRASGEPHPWPRVWVVVAAPGTPDAAMRKLDAWLAEQPSAERRRCGVASGAGTDGRRVVAVVAVDALADLAPLPIRARTGQWLEVEARMRVRARGGKVIVLGPSGAPRSLPTAFDGVTLRARFALDRPGEFAVQVIADVDGGPRPVLEASVFADAEPPSSPSDRTAPGEDEGLSPARDDDERLARMLAAARRAAGLRPLVRDTRLDAIARAHAQRMASVHDLSHDAGDGSPVDRLRSAGLDARDIGENVAHAPAIALAHRALWASPSHRANLLGAQFDRVGVGVARDEHGDTWVAETFAGALR